MLNFYQLVQVKRVLFIFQLKKENETADGEAQGDTNRGCVTENLCTDKDAFSHILDTLIFVQKEHEM